MLKNIEEDNKKLQNQIEIEEAEIKRKQKDYQIELKDHDYPQIINNLKEEILAQRMRNKELTQSKAKDSKEFVEAFNKHQEFRNRVRNVKRQMVSVDRSPDKYRSVDHTSSSRKSPLRRDQIMLNSGMEERIPNRFWQPQPEIKFDFTNQL